PFLCALALGAALLAAGSASARSFFPPVVNGSTTIPPEWAGIWQFSDSTYDCNGVLKGTSTGDKDTLCAGVAFDTSSAVPVSGGSDGTTYSLHCPGTAEIFPNCNYTIDIVAHGTRVGDTFFSVTVIQTTYSGTGKGCDLFQDDCQQINEHST